MSDEQPVPRDPPNDDVSVDGLSENDLDALLAQASSLVDDIAEQVGPESIAPTQTALADEPAGGQSVSESPPPVDGAVLDAQLTELDALTQTTGAELGGTAPPADGKPAGTPGQPAAKETVSAEVPDFMREFTEPDADEPPDAVSDDTHPDAPTDGVAAGATDTPPSPGDASTTVEGPPAEQVSAGSTDTADTPDTTGDDTAEETPSRFAALSSLLSDRANQAGLVSAELCISVLTILDRPFAGLSEKLKRLLGWVAISTTLTALIVLAISIA